MKGSRRCALRPRPPVLAGPGDCLRLVAANHNAKSDPSVAQWTDLLGAHPLLVAGTAGTLPGPRLCGEPEAGVEAVATRALVTDRHRQVPPGNGEHPRRVGGCCLLRRRLLGPGPGARPRPGDRVDLVGSYEERGEYVVADQDLTPLVGGGGAEGRVVKLSIAGEPCVPAVIAHPNQPAEARRCRVGLLLSSYDDQLALGDVGGRGVPGRRSLWQRLADHFAAGLSLGGHQCWSSRVRGSHQRSRSGGSDEIDRRSCRIGEPERQNHLIPSGRRRSSGAARRRHLCMR